MIKYLTSIERTPVRKQRRGLKRLSLLQIESKILGVRGSQFSEQLHLLPVNCEANQKFNKLKENKKGGASILRDE